MLSINPGFCFVQFLLRPAMNMPFRTCSGIFCNDERELNKKGPGACSFPFFVMNLCSVNGCVQDHQQPQAESLTLVPVVVLRPNGVYCCINNSVAINVCPGSLQTDLCAGLVAKPGSGQRLLQARPAGFALAQQENYE
jgi:hypothetical protein